MAHPDHPGTSSMNGSLFTKVFPVVISVLMVAGLGSLAWTWRTIMEFEGRLSRVEASRMTTQDGMTITRELADLKAAVAALPNSLPPRWFVDQFERHERESDQRLKTLESERKGTP